MCLQKTMLPTKCPTPERKVTEDNAQRAHDIKLRRINVDATCFIDVDTTSFWHQMSTEWSVKKRSHEVRVK